MDGARPLFHLLPQHPGKKGSSLILPPATASLAVQDVLSRLTGVKKMGDGYLALCPAHEDRSPSLSVTESEGGRILLHCHAGCETPAVLDALGIDVRQLFPPSPGKEPQKKNRPSPLTDKQVQAMHEALLADEPLLQYVKQTLKFNEDVIKGSRLGLLVAGAHETRRWLVYPYQLNGQWTFANCRSLDGPKTFMRVPSGQPTSLYRESTLVQDGTTILVEGERDALAALSMGLAAEVGGEAGASIVAMPGVSLAQVTAKKLKTQKLVYLALDWDEPGNEASDAILKALGPGKCRRVSVKGYKDIGEILEKAGPSEALDILLKAIDKSRPPHIIPDFISGSQILDTKYAPIEYAINPIAPRGEVVEWTGKHAIFKSTLALAACLSVATGRRLGPMPALKGKAVFITAEDDERTVALRVGAWLEAIPIGEARAEATKCIRNNAFFLTREHLRGVTLMMMEYGTPGPRTLIVEKLTEMVNGAFLVFLETAARLADGDENANRVQAAFANALEEIATGSGASVGIVRHVSKQAARDDTTDSYAGRGGGALSDAVRSIVNFTRPEPKNSDEQDPLAPVVMTHGKSTHCRKAEQVVWQPVEASCGGIYLRALTGDEKVRADAVKLLALLPPEGFTMGELHKKPLPGLTRRSARIALELLIKLDWVEAIPRSHGKNKKALNAYVPKEGKTTPEGDDD
jgi:hypothetical protein